MEYQPIQNRIRSNRIPIARSGYPFVLIAALVTGGFALIGFGILAILGLMTTLFIVYFFRDPDRKDPVESEVIVAPADGRVVSIEAAAKGPFSAEPCKKIGIFMSLLDVHVNRMPFEGRIAEIRYNTGSFMAADRSQASGLNERNAILVETRGGRWISVVQVAGLIARRIVCRIRENEALARGERFGLIRFGSRVDLYLPESTPLRVHVGDRVRGGISVIGYLK
ncbi:MAG: phosphatidylserine decarboxylase family protein [Desulfobacterales bacterium CG23_combo_of_CG06-09_8_20_14_all_52_9]|nr:MAG: phosphatidylserine decarboxylase family protein [Desulfobacterales bacterium CG23_combo_of_CG06-09_8_20_14_all_52_9]